MSDSTVGNLGTGDGQTGPSQAGSAEGGPTSSHGPLPGAETPSLEQESPEFTEHVSPDDATILSGRATSPQQTTTTETNPAELGRVLEGERLNHFQMDAFVGGGGMGAVFRGTDTALGRTVAIKVLLQRYSNDEETTLRFKNEAQSTARLDHENIARVYYVGEDRGWHYIVLEYVEGENIRDLVYRHGPFSLEDTVNYTLQIADALDHASSRDVVHRDIKPSNVLISKGGRAKLVDMGLARLHQVENSHEDLTASGVTLGTFDYISPEQARDPRNADVRSDLYSLGCTVYFMLTAEPPFPEGTVLQKLLQHQGDKPPDPSAIRPELPEEICAITTKLLSKNPQDRYQKPLELSADLLLLANDLNLRPLRNSSIVMTPATASSAWTVRHLPWIVPTSLLLLIALLVHYTSRFPENAGASRSQIAQSNLQRHGSSDEKPKLPAAATATNPLDGATGRSLSSATDEESPAKVIPTIPANSQNKPEQNGIDYQESGITRSNSDVSTPEGPVPLKTEQSSEGGRQRDLANPNSGDQPLVVKRAGGGGFTSVADACREATSGSVIELNYSGRLEEPEQPILLAQRKLTIRAGEGAQPIIRFRPKGPDRVLYPRSMITVAGGSLTLSNVHLELEISAHARSEGWTLFEAVLADQIRLERCTLTIRNTADDRSAMYRNVSFFHVKSAPGRDRPMTDDTVTPLPRVSIELRDCIARGEAVFLRGDALFSVQLQWENGLLATTERLVEIEAQAAALPEDEWLEIDLQYVTALMEKGFCLMTSGDDERRLTPIRINCTDSILITDGAPLIEQVGPASKDNFRRVVQWDADRSFYENIDPFWRIDSMQSTMVLNWEWEPWQKFWGPGRERSDRPPPVLWMTRLPEEQPISAQQPKDYALSATPANPARSAATDGMSDAGFQILSLPEIPSPAMAPARPEWSPVDDILKQP
jgi:serine/threonine protein kinase